MATGIIKKGGNVFGEPITQSGFPFTATDDGIYITIVIPQSTSSCYLYINEDGSNHARIFVSGGAQGTLTFPVKKGRTYSINAASNYNLNSPRIYPFI